MLLSASLLLFSYLCGSLCSAVLISKLFALPDPRLQGSKNPGATNVLRLAGKSYAVFVLLMDMLKGLVPVLLARACDLPPQQIGYVACLAILGHMYPVFFGFKGGKGVATALGALLGLHFLFGVTVLATWLLIANFSGYSSLASMVSLSLAPLYYLIFFGRLDLFPSLFFITLLILYKHKDNITRLMDGKESKIKLKHSVLEDMIDGVELGKSPQPKQSAKKEKQSPRASRTASKKEGSSKSAAAKKTGRSPKKKSPELKKT